MFLQIPSTFSELANFIFIVISAGIGTYLTIRIQNLATKKDVKELTSITEEIKEKFRKSSEHSIHLKKLEIDALINYNSAASEFISALYAIEVSGINETNYEELKNAKKEIQMLDRKLNTTYFHLQLFFDDEKSRKLMTEFDQNIISFSDSLNRSIDELSERYSKLTTASQQNVANFSPVLSQAINNSKMDTHFYVTELNKVLEEKVESLVSSRTIFTKHAIDRIRSI